MDSEELINDFLDDVEILISELENVREECEQWRKKSESLTQELHAERDLKNDLKEKLNEQQEQFREITSKLELKFESINDRAEQLLR